MDYPSFDHGIPFSLDVATQFYVYTLYHLY